jgi:phage gpG-like protein
MPGGLISFNVQGTADVVKGLGAMMMASQNLTDFWRDVFAPKYYAQVQALFATGGRARSQATGQFTGGAWAPLSPKYKTWKDKAFPGKPILERTGRLRGSLEWLGTAPGPGGLFTAAPDHVLVGTTVPYGTYHQEGTAGMPARPFLPPPDPAIYAPLLEAWLVKAQRERDSSPGPLFEP